MAVTGRELIAWIQEHGAEDMECVVQYRDSGGNYDGGEVMDPPCLARCMRNAYGHPYDVDISYTNGIPPNCIVL